MRPPRIRALLTLACLVSSCKALRHHRRDLVGTNFTLSRVTGTEHHSGHAAQQRPGSIPKILHWVWMSGYDGYLAATKDPNSNVKAMYKESCDSIHGDWEVMFWDDAKAEALVEQEYPWFMPYWRSYDQMVKRSDAARAFILHKYGGMYLDLDTECFVPVDHVLEGYDVVLQGSHLAEGLNNGIMAFVPGHPLLMKYVDMLKARHSGSDTDPTQNDPIWQTGPLCLADTLRDYVKPEKVLGHEDKLFQVDGTKIKVYPAGTFFFPCMFYEKECNVEMEVKRVAKTVDYSKVQGWHRFTGSWYKPDNLDEMKRAKIRTLLHSQTFVARNASAFEATATH